WRGPPPPPGCKVFVGRIPRDIYEDKLVPLFERAGRIYEFRLMMGYNSEHRGYGFIKCTTRKEATQAIVFLDNYEISSGRFITVQKSLDRCHLFISSIPEEMKKEEIQEEIMDVTDGVVAVIVYPNVIDRSKNRRYAYVDYETHRAAAQALWKLVRGLCYDVCTLFKIYTEIKIFHVIGWYSMSLFESDKLQKEYERQQEAHSALLLENEEMKKELIHKEELLKVSLADAELKHEKALESISQLEEENSELTKGMNTLRSTVEKLGEQLCNCHLQTDDLKMEFEEQQ
ncbi:hypothetical protein QTP86_003006, partial [Hemibagrus guttatus]